MMVLRFGFLETKLGVAWAAAVIGLLFACATAVTLALPHAAYAASESQPKIVMIGDSYSIVSKSHGVKNPWPERVSSYLGIPKSKRAIYRHSGYGFAKSDHRFLDLLKGVKRDKAVTDVLIVGGAGNDRYCSKTAIEQWYKKTIKRLKYLYPNATIMHTITSWDLNSKTYRKLLTAHIPYYKKAALKNGVVYLNGCETVIRGNRSYFAADCRHPNEAGQRAISVRVAKMIRLYNPRYAKAKVKKQAASTSARSAWPLRAA